MSTDNHIMIRAGDINCPCHINPELEVMYVKNGTVTVIYENTKVTLSRGEATVVLPYSLHSFEADSECDAEVFMFSNSLADGLSAGCNFENKFTVSHETHAYIDRMLLKKSLNSIDAKALLYAFASESPHINSENSSKSEQFRSVVEWIYQRIGDRITLDSISAELGIGKRNLASLFKSRLNITFNDFLNGIRTEKAKIMLLKGELTITEIAYECGFGSVRSFNRAFLRFAECNPGEYKKQQMSANDSSN